jgi:hypothetical protein
LQTSFLSKLVFVAAFLSFSLIPVLAAPVLPAEDAGKLLPDRVGDFRAQGAARPAEQSFFGKEAPEDFNAYSSATRAYLSAKGGAFTLTLVRTHADPGAYALLTRYAAEMRGKDGQLAKADGVGTAGFATPERVVFFKGAALVQIMGRGVPQEQLLEFARSFAETLSTEENDIPALVKHLPDWETARERAAYVVSHNSLQAAAGNREILDAIDFSGGTEAVVASYDASQLVIVEFSTPQISIDNDKRITARLKELREAGQSVPTAYRRVGNYSVFVFDAPDEQSAGQLIDRISYEKVVQWLGDNPRAFERAVRNYNETASNLIVGVIKASGFISLMCVAVGCVFGGLVFMRRRAQQASTDKYSDAGGMVRLNIDEMTPETNPARLLGEGDG